MESLFFNQLVQRRAIDEQVSSAFSIWRVKGWLLDYMDTSLLFS